MSSMTDIVFLLLVFFMVTSTLIAPNALKLLLPESNSQTMTTKPITTVSITYDLKFAVEGNFVPFENLESTLRASVQKSIENANDQEHPTISLHADKTVDIEYVTKVMNIAKNNGYKLILATSPIKK
ncbi:MAG: biopolymer transporter ExbD [Salinivirgaceae bacterium]|nr:biopolymer transporter ExbD [Salinivirgaceae bacterium]